MNKRLTRHNLNVIALSLCCFHYWSCKEVPAEKPVKTSRYGFHKSSAELYRKLYADEAQYIEAYIRQHPNKEYKKTASGFWAHRPEGRGIEKTSARHDDEIYFTYSIQDFNGQTIYREDEIGLQKIRPGKASIIRGIEETLKTIREGENRELLLPSFYAYGISGDGNKIRSNQPIIVQLKRLKNSKKMIRTFSILSAFALITLSCRTPKIMINKETYQNLNDGLYAYIQTDKGNMLAQLYDQKAPMTVANFVGLAEGKIPNKAFPERKPFYDGLTFHRIIKDFMIQGGDPQGDGRGGPGYQFPTEIHESLTHNKKGIFSMANSGPDTNGSQFFITHKETPWLDGKYNIFGEVIQGLEIIDSIAEVKTGGADRPLESIAIQKITIVRKGDAYKNYDGAEAFQSKMNDLKKVDQAIIQRQQEMTTKAQEISDELKYVILKEGAGAPVRSGDRVEVHYTLWLDNGKKIDSSHDRAEPLNLTAGVGQVIKGWDRILQELKKGSEAYAIIPPQWGYGSRGAGNVIPPDATLYFEIKVLE